MADVEVRPSRIAELDVFAARAFEKGETERYINSSCDPNTYVVTRDGVRHVVALRSIAPDTELTYDYLLNCDGGAMWECACRASSCRRVMPGSFFDLPREEQRRLRPLLDEWFVAEHADRFDELIPRDRTASESSGPHRAGPSGT